jgi:hypothetical protein
MLFGVANLRRPGFAQAAWIGRAARKPGAQVIIRAQGARDLGLGAGALSAIGRARDEEARRWLAMLVLADVTDLVATYLARRRLPKRRARLAMGFAGGSTLLGLLGVAGLGRGGDADG